MSPFAEAVAFLSNSFWEIVATGALFLALYFMKAWKSQISESMSTFQAQLSSLFQDGKDTRDSLKSHSDDMGKATKAINGDMLKIQKNIFTLEQDLNRKVESVVNEAAAIARDFESLSNQLKLGIESFDARYGRVLELHSRFDELNGKIIIIEEKTAKVLKTSNEHSEAFNQTKQILKKMRTELNGLHKKGDS